MARLSPGCRPAGRSSTACPSTSGRPAPGDAGSCSTDRRPSTSPAQAPASHLLIAHLCDTWRDDAGRRPPGLALGHVVPVGEPLARYTVIDRSGARTSRLIRRRFEVNDGILGWGSTAFAALPHVENEAIDWRGPHAAQTPGRYAPAGQSGTLTIMPGVYGTSQTGVSDFVPSATDDALLWLVAIELGAGAQPVALELEPLGGGPAGQRPDRGRCDGVSGHQQSAPAQRALPGPRRGRRRAGQGRSRDDHPNAPRAGGP